MGKPSEEECESICMEYCAAEEDNDHDHDDDDDVEDDDDKCDPTKEDCKPEGDEVEDEDEKPDDEDDEKPDDDQDDKPDDEDDEKPEEDDDKPEEKPEEDDEEEPEAFDPSTCPADKYPVSWNKADKQMKQMFTSANSKFYMVNIQKGKFPEAKPASDPYTGFLMFAQKYCGADFINQMNNGDVTVDFYDQSVLLFPGAVFKRDDNNKSATVQFKVNKDANAEDFATTKMDKFYLSINGFGDVDFGKKTFDDCINNMQ